MSDPDEALALLDNLAAQVNLTREQHTQVAQAVATIRAALDTSNVVTDTGDTLGQ